jgi:hypothetical protein
MNNDLISRNSVIELLKKWSDGYSYIELPTEDAIKQMSALPAVEPEIADSFYIITHTGQRVEFEMKRPKGKWKVYGKQGNIPITDMCSNCRYEMKWYKNKHNFCPNCGADMRGDTE